jgi:drug/metabolite transporter (DMT)-like permease
MRILLVLIGTQLLYSVSDLMGRAYMARQGFRLASFLTAWFLVYLVIRQVAMFGHLYVFAYAPLGKTMALLAATSIVLSNLLGYFLLGEVLSLTAYAGVMLAVFAVLLLAFR